MKQTTVATVDVNRNPKEGDVLKIANRVHVVVKAGRSVSEDRLRGDSYSVDYFDTILEDALGEPNPRVQHFALTGGSMSKEGCKLISPGDIELVRTAKLKTKTVTTYELA